MKSSIEYYKKIALTSRFFILKTKEGSGFGQFGKLFQDCFTFSDVWASGGKNLENQYPDLFTKNKGKFKLKYPSLDYWYSENEGSYKRGDIFIFPNKTPPFGSIEGMEIYILWNYSMIVNSFFDRWLKEQYESKEEKYLLQSTNRIVGNEYMLVAATFSGMEKIFSLSDFNKLVPPWGYSSEPEEEAFIDIKKHWSSKWFVRAHP